MDMCVGMCIGISMSKGRCMNMCTYMRINMWIDMRTSMFTDMARRSRNEDKSETHRHPRTPHACPVPRVPDNPCALPCIWAQRIGETEERRRATSRRSAGLRYLLARLSVSKKPLRKRSTSTRVNPCPTLGGRGVTDTAIGWQADKTEHSPASVKLGAKARKHGR